MNLIRQALRELPAERIPITQIRTEHLKAIEAALGPDDSLPIGIGVCGNVLTSPPGTEFFLVCGRRKVEAARASGRKEVTVRILAGDSDTAQRGSVVIRDSSQAIEFAKQRWPAWKREDLLFLFTGGETPNQFHAKGKTLWIPIKSGQ